MAHFLHNDGNANWKTTAVFDLFRKVPLNFLYISKFNKQRAKIICNKFVLTSEGLYQLVTVNGGWEGGGGLNGGGAALTSGITWGVIPHQYFKTVMQHPPDFFTLKV
jgi:hypothetical protein